MIFVKCAHDAQLSIVNRGGREYRITGRYAFKLSNAQPAEQEIDRILVGKAAVKGYLVVLQKMQETQITVFDMSERISG